MKLLSLMCKRTDEDVRHAYIVRMRDALGRKNKLIKQMEADGFEPVECSREIMSDGRAVVRVGGQSWAQRQDVHAEQLAAAFEDAKKRQVEPEANSVAGTESLSAMTCPKCGDSLQHTIVCPKCAAGKLGYRHRYTCVCGGVDMVSKERL